MPALSLELEYKQDAERACERMEAWWHREILDRPTIQVSAPRSNPKSQPSRHHASLRERWMDVEYVLDSAETSIANTYWGGELLPAFWPNLGPDVMAAALGSELQFGEHTSWSEPTLHNWEDIGKLVFDPQNIYVRTILEMTRAAVARGKNKYIVGLTDLHPGSDLAAALRDPQQLCLDVALEPERVKELMLRLEPTFFEFYELQHRILREAGQTLTTSWLPLYTEGRYYIPSADFSCMISPDMFREFFLKEIVDEINWLDRSIYHLDGPGAVRHLDALLEIEKLDAVQYVCGAGQEPTAWLPVFKRIQDAGKNIHVSLESRHLDAFMENLRPEGVMLCTWAVSIPEADALIAKVSRWK